MMVYWYMFDDWYGMWYWYWIGPHNSHGVGGWDWHTNGSRHGYSVGHGDWHCYGPVYVHWDGSIDSYWVWSGNLKSFKRLIII